MRWAFFKSVSIFSIFFMFGFYISNHQNFSTNKTENYDFSSRAPNSIRTWAVSTYLPENINQKVYLTIEGKQIKSISPTKPANVAYVLETETIAFAGLTDMHNHIKYNVLPLWDGGQAQYKNRYEWRALSRYSEEVTGMMHGFDKDGVCAAFRWGELRALAGGTTAMQGGRDSCTTSFGPMNIEVKGELSPHNVRAATDPLGHPSFMGNVYSPLIRPQILRSRAQLESLSFSEQLAATNRLYDVTLLNLLKSKGIIDWMSTFANQPRTLRTGVKLLIGQDYALASDNLPETFEKLVPEIQKFLTSSGMKEKDQTKQIENMRLWLFGNATKKGYLTLGEPANPPIQDLALLDNSQVMDFYGKGGVISPEPKIRRYLTMFETAARRSYLKTYSEPNPAIVAHLAEGARNDQYNNLEYQFASEMGLVQKGLVIIHAVGLNDTMLQDAAKKGVALVWSPTSNLLLYGETLDVVRAKQLGLTIALGSDWGPSGTKSMLDELKIARQYLDKIKVAKTVISDKDLYDMATINAAKSLGIENSVGLVAPLYLANILFVNKSAVLARDQNPYSALVKADANDVELVVVGGEPVYGEQKILEDVSTGFRDATPPEAISRCDMQKAFRFPFHSNADTSLQKRGLNFKSVTALETILTQQFAAFKVKLQTTKPRLAPLVPLKPDSIYPCEDTKYLNYMNNYISTTLDQFNKNKQTIRTQFRLKPNFNAMGTAEGELETEAQAE